MSPESPEPDRSRLTREEKAFLDLSPDLTQLQEQWKQARWRLSDREWRGLMRWRKFLDGLGFVGMIALWGVPVVLVGEVVYRLLWGRSLGRALLESCLLSVLLLVIALAVRALRHSLAGRLERTLMQRFGLEPDVAAFAVWGADIVPRLSKMDR